MLIRDLHRSAEQRTLLAGTAILATGAVATAIGTLFAVAAPLINPQLRELGASPIAVAVFAAGVALTTLATVVDDILLGLLRARLRLLRNAIFNVAKIGVLVAVGLIIGGDRPIEIYGAWGAGVVISLVVLVPIVRRNWRGGPLFSWSVLRQFGPSAVSHQALNTALQLPALGIPFAVALLAPPTTTAQFFVVFMLTSVSFYVPLALSQTLYAIGSRAREQLWDHARVTIGASIAAGALAVVTMAVLAEPILGLFGPEYAAAAPIAPLLAAVSIPMAVKDHFHMIFRIQHRERLALGLCAVGALLEVAGAVVGLALAGILGLSLGWLLAASMEAVVMAPLLLRAARHNPHA